ncbi:MAG: T9SS type B sorting domain-containing protein [Flavobacteriaceae bacterium]|nr:T9SS type B sorting domain-containing protein [Flavobacteriaceae bacterium]
MQSFVAGLFIDSFTATQLSGFKYRFAYDDDDGFLWGFCIQESAIVSSVGMVPNCDSVVTNPSDGEIGVVLDDPITWTTSSGFTEGYLVSIGTTNGGTDILDSFDNDVSLTFDPAGLLAYSTEYFVTITPYNNIGPAVGCTSSSFTTEDEATCTNPVATFELIDNCDVGEEFFVAANIEDLGSASSVDVEDVFGGLVNLSAPGTVQLGPYANGTDVVLIVTNADDNNCFITSGTFNLIACPPDNDFCLGAVEVFCDDTITGDTTYATENDELTDFCGTSQGAPGVWYSFTGTGDVVTFSLCGTTFDTKIQVYEGECGSLVCIDGNDDSCGFQSEVEILSDAGTTYYIYVFGFGTNTGTFILDVNCIPPPEPPVNDDCSSATVITANADEYCTNFISGTIYGATPSLEANNCSGEADDDVWFQFEAVSEEVAIDISNIVGDTQDLYHVLYEGSGCEDLTELYCSDPNQSVASGLTIGGNYFIRVYSFTENSLQNVSFDICVFTVPPPILTNDTTYTIEELVEDVLIDTDCSLVSNITYSTGTDFGSTNGIGYFEANGSSFPFESGLILTTGDVLNAPGPETETISDGDFSWPGDTDLENAIPGLFPDVTNNASVIEFDFIPIITQMSFDFIFAAEEYGTFQCTFTDAFAFLLTDPDGLTTNIALVPGTTDPISVLNVRDEAYNSNCPSVNPEYFGAYYGNGGFPALTNPTNFIGRTVVMTAMADVIPNEQYHIKIVIADDQDTLFDSAVFLAAGSFDIGELDLGEDILLTSGNANCQGDQRIIDAGVLPLNSSIEWFADGELIEGESSTSLAVTDTAVYTAVITINDTDCSFSDDILIEFFQVPQPEFAEPSIIKCANEEFILQVNVANVNDLNSLTYNWFLDGNQVQSSDSDSYVLSSSAEEQGTFTVVVSDDITGCNATAQIDVEFYENSYCIDLPQGLSPNGDGDNDCLILDHLDDKEDITRIDIFNRLGVKIYELNEYIDQWCGTDQDGKKLPVGTYYYIIHTRSKEPIKSWIYLNY